MSSIKSNREGGPLILCAGIAVIDYVFRLDRFPAPDIKTRANQFIAINGGCAANAAVALTRLGGRARLVAPLGNDALGAEIMAGLRREGVMCDDIVQVTGAVSPISAIMIDSSGERIIVNYRDERLDIARVFDLKSLLAAARGVLIDNRFPEFVLPIATEARQRGLPILLDGDKPTSETDILLRTCTHVIFSAEGLRATAGLDDLDAALRYIARQTDTFLAVTDGANGIWWIECGKTRHLPAFPVRAVDTLGAGDVFHAAFALALAEARDMASCLRFAAAAAAIKCTRFGGITGAPSRVETEAFLRDHTLG
ncbi:MAG: sugar kinase [Rhizobiales bacterium]|nr:sugar kinase [Hyphomicrobiales bacterium]